MADYGKIAIAAAGAVSEMKKSGHSTDEILGYVRMIAAFPFIKPLIEDWINKELAGNPESIAVVKFLLGYK